MHRRITCEDRPQYDDDAAAAAAPAFDLHSVAESMRKAGRLQPWELPSVRSPEEPTGLTLEELRRYRQQYPY